MIKIKHYSHNYNSVNPCPLCSNFGESNTDTSKWRPDISIARAQAGMNSGKQLLYDFPDGKDNGETVQTFIRSKGLDITEIDTAEKRITQIIEDKKQKDKDLADFSNEKKRFFDNIQKLADSAKSDSSDSSGSSDSSPK